MSDQVGCYLLQFVGIDRQDQRVVRAVQMYIDVFSLRYTIEPVYHVPDTRYDVGRTDLKCQLSLVQFLIVELLLDQSDEAEAVALDFGEAVGIVVGTGPLLSLVRRSSSLTGAYMSVSGVNSC